MVPFLPDLLNLVLDTKGVCGCTVLVSERERGRGRETKYKLVNPLRRLMLAPQPPSPRPLDRDGFALCLEN